MNPKDKLMKVVFFVPSLDGGIGRISALLASGLKQYGKNVEVWSAAPKSGYANELEKIVKVKYIGNGSVKSALWPLINQLRLDKPNTLISASFHANCIAILASIFARKKIQYAIVDHPSIDASLQELSFLKWLLWRMLILLLYPIANKHIAISHGVAEAMSKYGRVDLSKIAIITNPVISDDIFTQSAIEVQHPFFDLKDPVLLYVGRLSREKDVPNLIKAFKISQKQMSSRLIIIGDGPDWDILKDMVKNENIDDKISFLGHLNNPYPYFAKSDVFVLSSTREGLPSVLIEALAFGLRVVSTDCPSGPKEILNHGAYGHLVKINDSSAFADAIISSLNNPAPVVPKLFFQKYEVETATLSYMKILSL